MRALACLSALLLAVASVRAGVPERTLMVALSVDRDGTALVGTAAKDRPFRAAPEKAAGPDVRLELALLGPGGERRVQHKDVAGLCLDHPPETEEHLQGDAIWLHRETVIVEVPEVAGFGRLEVSWLPGAGLARVPLGTVALDTPASDFSAGTVQWPEHFEDGDVYTVFGSEAEVGSRINVVLVPDGYTYAEKGTMLAHAQALVTFFRSRTPFLEHDLFVNYILVYAYSSESGTDQCDCSIVRDTAMRTRFPLRNPTCGHTDNRCLFYGTGNGGPSCDSVTSSMNIAAAELRAPAQDVTLVMVNTERYGGCGGSRAVYSAANPIAVEIALHELGHSLAGLADEYTTIAACAPFAREINTSTDPLEGAWPEWIPEVGLPIPGGEEYGSCIYHPQLFCQMRVLGVPFCPVCNQQWALRFFGHARVSPTAPIASMSPPSPVTVQAGLPVTFTAATRLPVSPTLYAWREGQVLLATDGAEHTRAFPATGLHELSLDVTADTSFVKKERTGPNLDRVTWQVEVLPVPEVPQLSASRSALDPTKVDLSFADTGATVYDLYISREPFTSDFQVASPALGKRICGLPAESLGVDLETGITGDTSLLYFLVTADNGPGIEGPLGHGRTADARCSP